MVGDFLLQKKQRQVIERNLAKSILSNIAKAKKRGYFIELHYIGGENADIAKERVARRIKQGGHGISE